MPIELTCSSCGQTLRVPDDAAGKQARCPSCKHVQPIPASPAQGFPSGAPPTASPYADSPEHTPASPAGNPFAPYSTNPYADHPVKPADQAVNPYASPAAMPEIVRTGGERRYLRTHRGGAILTLGILSLFCNVCFIPCIMALTMGSEDLKLMNSGKMDPSGRTLTNVGMVLAVVGLMIQLAGIAFNVLASLH